MRKLQTNPNYYPRFLIGCLGDSQTDFLVPYGVSAGDNWTGKLCEHLNNIGAATRPVNAGRGADTLSDMLARADKLFMYGTPTIGIIWGGVNDALGSESTATGTATSGGASTITLQNTASDRLNAYYGCVISITSGTGSGQSKSVIGYSGSTRILTVDSAWTTPPNATSVYSIARPTQAVVQSNMQACIKAIRYGCVGYGAGLGQGVSVYGQAQLPANGFSGQRFVVMNDTSTTGGAAINISGINPTITGNYSGTPRQSVWEYRNPQAGEFGWGRVAIAGTTAFIGGVSKVIVMPNNYFNYSTGGDNYNVAAASGTQYSATIPIRAAISAAATAETGVVYCDLYAYQSALIFGGATFQGASISAETAALSFSWHYTDSNLHHNKYGHSIVARSLYQTIVNQGWAASLIAT